MASIFVFYVSLNIIFLTTDKYHCNKMGWGEGVISKETVEMHWLTSEI